MAALLLADREEVERAVERYARAQVFGCAVHSRWFEDVYGRRMAAAAKALPPETVAAAEGRGRERDPWATVVELLAEWVGEDNEAWRGREITPKGWENEQSGQS